MDNTKKITADDSQIPQEQIIETRKSFKVLFYILSLFGVLLLCALHYYALQAESEKLSDENEIMERKSSQVKKEVDEVDDIKRRLNILMKKAEIMELLDNQRGYNVGNISVIIDTAIQNQIKLSMIEIVGRTGEKKSEKRSIFKVTSKSGNKNAEEFISNIEKLGFEKVNIKAIKFVGQYNIESDFEITLNGIPLKRFLEEEEQRIQKILKENERI